MIGCYPLAVPVHGRHGSHIRHIGLSVVGDCDLAGSNVSTLFVNYVFLTDTAAYVTDSMEAQFYTGQVKSCALGLPLADRC